MIHSRILATTIRTIAFWVKIRKKEERKTEIERKKLNKGKKKKSWSKGGSILQFDSSSGIMSGIDFHLLGKGITDYTCLGPPFSSDRNEVTISFRLRTLKFLFISKNDRSMRLWSVVFIFSFFHCWVNWVLRKYFRKEPRYRPLFVYFLLPTFADGILGLISYRDFHSIWMILCQKSNYLVLFYLNISRRWFLWLYCIYFLLIHCLIFEIHSDNNNILILWHYTSSKKLL